MKFKPVTQVNAFENNQIAFPVGINKDAINLTSYYKEDIKTGVITAEHRLYRNFPTQANAPLHIGTHLECQALAMKIIEEEGDWEYNEDYKLIYNKPNNK